MCFYTHTAHTNYHVHLGYLLFSSLLYPMILSVNGIWRVRSSALHLLCSMSLAGANRFKKKKNTKKKTDKLKNFLYLPPSFSLAPLLFTTFPHWLRLMRLCSYNCAPEWLMFFPVLSLNASNELFYVFLFKKCLPTDGIIFFYASYVKNPRGTEVFNHWPTWN